jgi:FkbM family methyltransferase
LTTQKARDTLAAALTARSPADRDSFPGPFVLYGAGSKGRETLNVLQKQGYEVRAFIDRARSDEHAGVPILTPDDPAVLRFAAEGCTAIVTVFNPGVDPLPIHELLAEKGFCRVVGMVEARQFGLVSDAFWLAAPDQMTPPAQEADWLFNSLADDLSRRTFEEAIVLRKTGDVRQLRLPTPLDQYVPAGVPIPRTSVRFVDGGAFDGDTIVQLINAGVRFEAVAAFEPDRLNYAALVERTRNPLGNIAATLWPCGLDAVPRQVRFSADGLASSGIAEQGSEVIQTVAIDTALRGWRPSYIKLDIEGAEADALRGMSATLQAARPAVAVCVYHKPADLWQLPRLVADLLPDADLFLRSHAWNGFDLVLYAIPREMANSQ